VDAGKPYRPNRPSSPFWYFYDPDPDPGYAITQTVDIQIFFISNSSLFSNSYFSNFKREVFFVSKQ